MTDPLFPRLADPDDAEALLFPDRILTYAELSAAAATVAERVAGAGRVAVWAENEPEVCVAVLGALAAGVAIVPVNPANGSRELEHIASDSRPDLLFARPGAEVAQELGAIERIDVAIDVAPDANAGALPDRLGPEDTAFVLYTSGTTGPPKGVQIPRRAIESNLDALAAIWGWTGDDRLAEALPLFHVHGLVIGVLGSLRLGGSVEHTRRFSPSVLSDALRRGATMMFGVPTMYHRIANEAEKDPEIAAPFARARLLVSGSAALPAVDHARIERLTGQRIVERYGMTETLMNVSVRADGERRPGSVGLPLPGVELRLTADDGSTLETSDDETIGEIQVRGPNLFTGYLNRPGATEETMRDGGWFATGDLATRAADGYIRIVGRRATDLIKSGGFKIGAGEIEGALLEHAGVAEVAVAGRPDHDMGERVEAWVVRAAGSDVDGDELKAHVGELLAPYKRPRRFHFVDELPRNAMGKVMKRDLPAD